MKKARQMMVIVTEDIRRQTHKAEQQMQYQVKELMKEAEKVAETSMERHRKLVLACECRRQTSTRIKERL